MDFILNTNNLILLVMFTLSGALLFGAGFRGFINGQTVTPAAATLLINRRKAAVIDLRNADVFAQGHLAKAKNILPDQFPGAFADLKLDKQNPVILVCDTGSRSASTIKKFKSEGFSEVLSLEGGMKAWSAAGLPLVTK